MRILNWLGGAIGVTLLAVVALVIGARFGDGPIAIIPGGPLQSGERVTGAEPDWTFASPGLCLRTDLTLRGRRS